MAEIKISALPAATTPLAGTELIEIVQSGTNKKVAASELGGTATLPVLESADTTLWLIGVTDAGVLTTTQTADVTPTTLSLFSVDNTEYEVTVSNEGVLITTEV